MSTGVESPRYVADAMQDVRVAMRRMRRAPVFTVAIVLTIALGLGGASAIFTTFRVAIVEPLPYFEPDRLVFLGEQGAGDAAASPTSLATLVDWRTRSRSFSVLEGYDPANLTVGAGDEARMLRGAHVTAGFFRLLGVRPVAGRDFAPGEEAAVGPGVAIVSERLANSVVGGSAVNRTIVVNGAALEVVGVLPRSFHFALLQDADVFQPLVIDGDGRSDRTQRSIHVVGRLNGEVPLAAARAELSGVMASLAAENPEAMSGRTIAASPLKDALLGNVASILTSLLLAVILLLVIMAANLALLMLSRHMERAPELAIRTALGASRARMLRQLVVESLVPGLAGAIMAIVIGQGMVHVLIGTIPESVRVGMPYLAQASLGRPAIAAMLVATTVLVAAFGLGPALRATRAARFAGDLRSTTSRGDRGIRRALVGAQVAVTVVLLISSGLLVVSFSKLMNRDLGFRSPESLVVMRAPLSGQRYRDAAAQQQFYETLLARAGAIPGAHRVSLIDEVPGGGGGSTTYEPVESPRLHAQQPRAALRRIGGEYFATMGIPVLAGRTFDARDRNGALPVVVVSNALARRLERDGVVVGRRLRLAATDDVQWEVVGVVGDVQVAALDADSPPVIYLSHLQAAENRMTLVFRTESGSPIVNQVRSIVKAMDPGVPVYGATTISRQLQDSKAVFSRRLPMLLSGLFGALAFTLTLIALYAICMREVQTRRREFGIRIALGSPTAAIRRLIWSDVVLVGLPGATLGVLVAGAVARSMQALLFGISAIDWRVYGGVALGVLAAALLVTLVPAIRAGAVNASVVMRAE